MSDFDLKFRFGMKIDDLGMVVRSDPLALNVLSKPKSAKKSVKEGF